jgi:hypothetical protein
MERLMEDRMSKAKRLFRAGVASMIDNPSQAFNFFVASADIYEDEDQINLSQHALEYAFSCQMSDMGKDNEKDVDKLVRDARLMILCSELQGRYQS